MQCLHSRQKKATKTRDHMGIFKGQGATEYLVLLAVVLIVALVSVALLGFFPGMASDARITQSQAYWKGQAKPFAILDAAISGTTATLSVQNMEANGPYTISANGIQINGAGTHAAAIFGAGETKTISITGLAACTSGAVYDYNVSVVYTTPSGISTKQFSAKNLVGKCA